MDQTQPDYESTLAGSQEIASQEKARKSSQDNANQSKKKKRFKMMCFSCNRPEYHSPKSGKRWLSSYILGLTFGLKIIFGPFTCSCCGSSRLMCRNWLSLRYWFRKRRTSQASSKR